jgi:putative oxidoreductase
MKWITHIVQGITALGFLMAGLSKLFSSEDQIREMFTDPLGYAPTFIYVIGAVETVASLTLIAGYRWRRAAAVSSLVLTIVMIGAIVSLLKANAVADAVQPAVHLVLLIVLLFRLIRTEAVFHHREDAT